MSRPQSLACLFVLFVASVALAETPDAANTQAPKVEKVKWAHVELKGSYPEGVPLPGLFGGVSETLADAIARLDKAAGDDDVKGLLLHVKSPSVGWGKLNELRQAIARVRKGGKSVYAYMDSADTKNFLLASACDKVYVPESGVVMVLGLRAEVGFYKNLFDKLGIEPQMLRVGEYKSAAEPYSRTEMSAAFREEMEAILDGFYEQIVTTIAEGRGLDREKVIAAIDNGPHTAAAAMELGLIDGLAYEDELSNQIEAANGGAKVSFVRKYGKKSVDTDLSGFAGLAKLVNLMMGIDENTTTSKNPRIAVIHATGAIMPGQSSSDLLMGEIMGSDTIVKAIETARDDEKVKALVLRVDSPGGSALASDLIWRALEKVEKPIVVSMGDVAASGGYYISMGADAIFAEPGTLTGSIGVVGGKLAMRGLWEKIGINTSIVARGKHSGILSTTDGFSESERAAMQKLLDDIYKQFTEKAARGRKMEYEQLEKLARGRVYTGEQALEIGLVDKLGTLDDAVAHARELAGLAPEDKIDRLLLPKPTSPFEQLFGPIDASGARGETSMAAKLLHDELESLSPELVQHLRMARLVELLSKSEPRLTLLPYRLDVR